METSFFFISSKFRVLMYYIGTTWSPIIIDFLPHPASPLSSFNRTLQDYYFDREKTYTGTRTVMRYHHFIRRIISFDYEMVASILVF